MRRIRSWRSLGIKLGMLPAAVAACVGGGVDYPDVEGRYEGAMVVEGQSIPGSLQLLQDRGSLSAVFDSPSLGLQANGTGQVSPEGDARIEVAYNLQCPGLAELSGDFGEDGDTFRGKVTASDCTGDLAGVFDFSR